MKGKLEVVRGDFREGIKHFRIMWWLWKFKAIISTVIIFSIITGIYLIELTGESPEYVSGYFLGIAGIILFLIWLFSKRVKQLIPKQEVKKFLFICLVTLAPFILVGIVYLILEVIDYPLP
ncbi:hypothetical protein [Halobacillus litoralis]|uniref:hypothetical protein n=1 Tax=Halobacillus litoralis TaxID=45668 RepID=UPI001CFD856B|nr:hypothetical protein [Halobacillus litoralis]